MYPSGVTSPDLSSIRTRHKHCGARLITDQKANQWQQSQLMELWLNKQVIWDTPPLPTVSKCGAQCHWLRTRPYTNGTDRSDKAGQSAERGNASHTRNHQRQTMRFMLNLPPLQTTQKIEQVKAYFSADGNPHNPLHEAVKDTKGCRLGWGKSWNGSSRGLSTAGITELKQPKERERYLNRFRTRVSMTRQNRTREV